MVLHAIFLPPVSVLTERIYLLSQKNIAQAEAWVGFALWSGGPLTLVVPIYMKRRQTVAHRWKSVATGRGQREFSTASWLPVFFCHEATI